ncbi:type II toxin-antitoxin system ParD family antitoxin [Sphingomonas canadensis]|uniref:Type II toxin-antitoxin system ParD family antitoxin n=1 Tax=Sphingomonas canadensis TaxID=1219257 RepID=A0ABW3HA36_9SPHN|nr:addiction module antitoxin [Sphingomonas canadensis]MCW3836241.1 addiction module antitoxin [Sphingomonas canadensis]
MSTTLNVRITGPLEDFVIENIGENGPYENASEYVRDLIRRDKERVEHQAFEALKAELQRAFAAPVERYRPLDREEFLERARQRWAR